MKIQSVRLSTLTLSLALFLKAVTTVVLVTEYLSQSIDYCCIGYYVFITEYPLLLYWLSFIYHRVWIIVVLVIIFLSQSTHYYCIGYHASITEYGLLLYWLTT